MIHVVGLLSASSVHVSISCHTCHIMSSTCNPHHYVLENSTVYTEGCDQTNSLTEHGETHHSCNNLLFCVRKHCMALW